MTYDCRNSSISVSRLVDQQSGHPRPIYAEAQSGTKAMAIKLDHSQLENFRLICDLGPEPLHAAVERLRELNPVLLRPNKLISAMAEALGENQQAAEPIVREALMAFGWTKQGGLQVADVQGGIRESLKAELPVQYIEKWERVEGPFGELLSLPILRLVANALDLCYEYTHLWRDARILTDIRPIFSDDAAKIDGAVVSHTFRLRFEDVQGSHELNIAMDETEILDLAEQCERAWRKAQVARDLMNDVANIPTIIAGEPEDG